MTISFDSQTNFWNSTSGPITDANTPGADLAGVLVLAAHEFDTDQVTGITYGGVAMTRIRSNVDVAGGVLFRTYVYFRGDSIPTGVQNLVVTRTNSANLIGQTIGLIAGADTEVVDHDGIDGNTASPTQAVLSYSGRTCVAFAIMLRAELVAGIASLSGQTQMLALDQGSWSMSIDRQTTPGTSDFTIGYTTANGVLSDNAFSAIALSEVAAAVTGSVRLVDGGFVNGGFAR